MFQRNNLKSASLLLAATLFSPMCLADFIIEYPAYSGIDGPYGSVLLMDNTYSFLNVIGKCKKNPIGGGAEDLSLANALNLLVPDGWTVGARDDVQSQLTKVIVDWYEGQEWLDILENVGRKYHIVFTVNCNKKTILISKGRDLGLWANSFDSGIPNVDDPYDVSDATKIYTFDVREGENLRDAIDRMAKIFGFRRSIVDFKSGSLDPLFVIAERHAVISATSVFSMGRELSKHYHDVGPIELVKANDHGGRALVLSNHGYTRYESLSIFEVEVGALRYNAKRLAEFFSWSVPKEFWLLDYGYQQEVAHALVVKNIVHGYSRIFGDYPIQAQLIDSNHQVIFTSRELPKNRK